MRTLIVGIALIPHQRAAWIVAGPFIVLPAACGPVRPPVGENPTALRADWNDIAPAADFALLPGECAILQVVVVDPRTTDFRLLSIDDDTGYLRFTRASPTDDEGAAITVSAFLGDGLHRDHLREGRLVKAAADRLRELAGVDVRIRSDTTYE
ncbi:hypothetical protein BH11PLA1_BH11PLA1_03610 [soil metagenome]